MVDVVFTFVAVWKDIGFVIEVIDGNYILVKRIIQIGHVDMLGFGLYFNSVKILNSIMRDKTKESIGDKLMRVGFRLK